VLVQRVVWTREAAETQVSRLNRSKGGRDAAYVHGRYLRSRKGTAGTDAAAPNGAGPEGVRILENRRYVRR
jgi:hypothetical protein